MMNNNRKISRLCREWRVKQTLGYTIQEIKANTARLRADRAKQLYENQDACAPFAGVHLESNAIILENIAQAKETINAEKKKKHFNIVAHEMFEKKLDTGVRIGKSGALYHHIIDKPYLEQDVCMPKPVTIPNK